MAMDHAYNEIKGIEAYVGGYPGVSYDVEIDFDSRLLTWRRFFCWLFRKKMIITKKQ